MDGLTAPLLAGADLPGSSVRDLVDALARALPDAFARRYPGVPASIDLNYRPKRASIGLMWHDGPSIEQVDRDCGSTQLGAPAVLHTADGVPVRLQHYRVLTTYGWVLAVDRDPALRHRPRAVLDHSVDLSGIDPVRAAAWAQVVQRERGALAGPDILDRWRDHIDRVVAAAAAR